MLNQENIKLSLLKNLFSIPSLSLFLISLLLIFVYHNSFQSEFVNWDDYLYTLDNHYIKNLSLQNLQDIFTKYYAANYHPLTIISFALDFAISKNNPLLYHITNIFLHLLNTILVFYFVLFLIRYKRIDSTIEVSKEYSHSEFVAFITACLFAIHPLHVESVAWISERKDVLYSFFFLSSLIAYIKYIEKGKVIIYISSLFLFLLSLLSKGQAVTLSLVLIIIDIFFNRKLISKRVIIEKIPFFILSFVFGIIAIYAQSSAKSVVLNRLEFYEQFLVAFYNYLIYIVKLIIPYKLSAFYPYPEKVKGFLPMEFYISPLLVGIIIAFVYLFRRFETIKFGFLFFTANIFLLLQLLPVGRTIMADRYTYIASIGFFFAFGIIYQMILDKYKKVRMLLIIIMVVYLSVLSYIANERVKVWKDSLSLWNDVLSKYDNVPEAYNNRGSAYISRGLYDEAIEDNTKSIALNNPQLYLSYGNRAKAYELKGLYDKALEDYNKSIELNPNYANTYNNIGNLYKNKGLYSKAISNYNKAIQLKPTDAEFYNNRGSAYCMMGLYDKAMMDFDKAIKLSPTSSGAYYNKGLLYVNKDSLDSAIANFNKAIKWNPKFVDAYINRGTVYYTKGLYDECIKDYTKAIELNPKYELSYYNRGFAYNSKGLYDKAIEDFNKIIELNPNYVEAYYSLGLIYEGKGLYDKAISEYEKFLKFADGIKEFEEGVMKANEKIQELKTKLGE